MCLWDVTFFIFILCSTITSDREPVSVVSPGRAGSPQGKWRPRSCWRPPGPPPPGLGADPGTCPALRLWTLLSEAENCRLLPPLPPSTSASGIEVSGPWGPLPRWVTSLYPPAPPAAAPVHTQTGEVGTDTCHNDCYYGSSSPHLNHQAQVGPCSWGPQGLPDHGPQLLLQLLIQQLHVLRLPPPTVFEARAGGILQLRGSAPVSGGGLVTLLLQLQDVRVCQKQVPLLHQLKDLQDWRTRETSETSSDFISVLLPCCKTVNKIQFWE